MALMELADHVDGIENMKLMYGAGFGDMGSPTPSAIDCERMLEDPNVTSAAYKKSGCVRKSATEKGVLIPMDMLNPQKSGPANQGDMTMWYYGGVAVIGIGILYMIFKRGR